ncbi:MAG: FAD:protein FMN transferase [Bacteroidales bacterium]|nr:FAD:protein FMN transferase [Bacteroidales bacterium]
MNKRQVIFVLGAVALTALAIFFFSLKTRYVAISGYAQGGKYTVTLSLPDRKTKPESLKAGIDSVLMRIDKSVSGYNPASLLSKFNNGEEFSPDDVFEDIFSAAYNYYNSTSGALNCAAGELFNMWGFGFTSGSLPSDEDVKKALERCDMAAAYSGKAEDLPAMPASERIKLNFNAIAQGYSSDAVASYLRSKGVKNMLVNIGGEIFYDGRNPSGKAWRIGVDNPKDGNFEEGADVKGIIDCPENYHAIVTSGNYRKYYIKDGRKYSHTIDPRTGYPVTHDLLSATIIAKTALDADALATTCMVIGFEQAKKLIEESPDLEGYLITSTKVWNSDGIKIINEE